MGDKPASRHQDLQPFNITPIKLNSQDVGRQNLEPVTDRRRIAHGLIQMRTAGNTLYVTHRASASNRSSRITSLPSTAGGVSFVTLIP